MDDVEKDRPILEETARRIIRRHGITLKQLKMMTRTVEVYFGDAGLRLTDEIDCRYGVGVIGAHERCVWTRDKRRITIYFPESVGGFRIGYSYGLDPECRVYGGWAEQLRLWVVALFSRKK